VNLAVFDSNGQPHSRTSVPLVKARTSPNTAISAPGYPTRSGKRQNAIFSVIDQGRRPGSFINLGMADEQRRQQSKEVKPPNVEEIRRMLEDYANDLRANHRQASQEAQLSQAQLRRGYDNIPDESRDMASMPIPAVGYLKFALW
jgi:hypothetical protein